MSAQQCCLAGRQTDKCDVKGVSEFLADEARAAIFIRAEHGGTLILGDRHRYCQPESSNNGEDEGETHHLRDVIWASKNKSEGYGRNAAACLLLNVPCLPVGTILRTGYVCIASRLPTDLGPDILLAGNV